MEKIYQCQELKRFNEAQQYYMRHCEEFCEGVNACLRSRMEWSDQQLMRDIISVLAAQGWEKIVEENLPLASVERLVAKFTIPLQGAQATCNCDRIKEEMQSLLQYAVHFISLSTLDYRAIWWRLFNAPSSSEWSNALILVELLLSLPASNGKLERVFSQLNVIKTNKRTSLSNESLDDLLLLTSDSVPLKDFCPDDAINLWWKDKVCQPQQSSRKLYKKQTPSSNLPVDESTGSSSQSKVKKIQMMTLTYLVTGTIGCVHHPKYFLFIVILL